MEYHRGIRKRIINNLADKYRIEEWNRKHYGKRKTIDGITFNREYALLRAVKFQNGSYGIIQNRLYRDLLGIDRAYECQNLLEDLTYEDLLEKWEKRKRSCGAEWLPDFSVW